MDEEFDTYEYVEDFSLVCSSNFSTGAKVLGFAGRPFCNPDDVDFVVETVED
jgi:hypothetical protein